MTFPYKKRQQGFTLIELLIVISIIAFLAIVVFVALNPSFRFSQARNARRSTDVETILTAIHEAIVDNAGSLPAGLSTGMPEMQLGTSGAGCAIATGGCSATGAACVNLTAPLAKYLKSMPIDPNGTALQTKYDVVVDSNNIVTVKACLAENNASISISR